MMTDPTDPSSPDFWEIPTVPQFQDLSLVHTQPTHAPPGISFLHEDRVVDEMAALQLTYGGTAATVPAPNGPTQPDMPDLDQENIGFDLANSGMFGLAQPPKRPSQRERRSNDPPARSSSTRRSGLPRPGGPVPLQRQPSSLGENRARIHRSSSASRIPVNAPLTRPATGGSRSSSVDRRGQVNGSSNSLSGHSTTANRRSAQVAAPARQGPGPIRVASSAGDSRPSNLRRSNTSIMEGRGGGPLTRARSRELQQRAQAEKERGDADTQTEESNPPTQNPNPPRQVEQERRGRDRTRRSLGQVAGPAPIRVVAQPRGENGGGAVAAAAPTARTRSIDRHLNNMPTNQRAFNASVNRRRVLSRSNSRGPTSTALDVPDASVAANPSAISPSKAVRPAAAAPTRSSAGSLRRPAVPTVSSTSRATRPSAGSAPRQPVIRDSPRPRAQPITAATPKRRSFKADLRAYPQPTTASRALSASRPAVAVGGEGGGGGGRVGTSGSHTPAKAMAGAGQPANSARRVDIAALTSRLMNPLRRSRQPEEPTQGPARGPTTGVRMQRPVQRTRSSSVASRNASAPPRPPVEAIHAEADTAAAEPEQEQSID